MTEMRRTEMLKKIGTAALSAALMLSLGVFAFVAGDEGMVASAAGTSGGTWITPTQWVSTESANTKNDTHKTAEERVNGKIEGEIFKSVSEGSSTVKIDGTLYGINSLSRDMIKELSDYELDAEFTFNYDGSHYVVTIPAGTAPVSEEVSWYGPKYLMSLYGDTASVTPIE